MARILLASGCSYSMPNVFPKNWKTISSSLKQHWYITYRFYDPSHKDRYPKGKQVMVKGMNDYADLKQRQASTAQYLLEIKSLLEEEGYNPITGQFYQTLIAAERTEPVLPEDGFWRAIIFARTSKVYDPETNTSKEVDGYLRTILKAALLLGLHIKPIGQFRRRDLLAIFKSIEDVKPLSCYSFNNCLGYIKPLFDILTLHEAMEVNPVNGIPKRAKPEKKRQVMDTSRRKLVDSHLKKTDRRFWLFINIFFHSGAREIELLKLKRSDLNIEKQTFQILVKKGNKKMAARTETKSIKNIALPFWNEYLRDYHEGDYIFSRGFLPGKKGITRDWLTHYWQKTVKIPLGIDEDLYSLKHLNFDETTELLGIEAAAKQAGHTSIAMGKSHYAVGEKQRELERLKKLKNYFAA